jgi:signal transduction histidine kinase
VSLQARLSLAFFYVGLLAVISLLIPLGLTIRDRVRNEVRSQSLSQAQLVAASVPGTTDLTPLVGSAAQNVRGRVLILDGAGLVRADSSGEARRGDDYSTRPEVQRALAGIAVQSERHSQTLGRSLLATAVPVLRAGKPVGAVRVTQGIDAVDRAVRRAWAGLAAVAAIVLGLGLVVGGLLARQIARPLRRLDAAAQRVAAGDLTARAPVEGSSEQRSLSRTFNDMTARLEALVSAQRRFVGDASHQLRTPLTGLRLRLEEAEAATDREAAAKELAAATDEVDRLSAMVHDLLALSEADEAVPAAEPVDLAEAVRRVADRWGAPAIDQGVRLDVTVDGRAVVRAARADVDRILDVLVENALAYAPDGERLVVSAGPGRLEVLDEGPGPEAGEEDAVFERFHRGRAGRSGPSGSGLGLAMARGLARRWGGDIRLERRTSGGARAVVDLPPE